MILVVLGGLCLGFFIPLYDSIALRNLVVGLFAFMTFITALSTSLKSFVQILKRPWIPLWILLLVHIVGPLIAYLLGLLFFPDELYTRIGFFIGASIPIGVTSIIWTSLVGGHVSIALVAVTLDTFIVPFILPALFHLVLGKSVNIDYWAMLWGLLKMVTIPSILGMLIHEFTSGKTQEFASGAGGFLSKLALFGVVFINSAMVMPHINWSFSMIKLLLMALLIVISGFFVGFLGSLILKDRSHGMMMTMVHNVGIRNNSCGLVLALSFFPASAAIPLTIAILFQQPVATFVTFVYKRFSKRS